MNSLPLLQRLASTFAVGLLLHAATNAVAADAFPPLSPRDYKPSALGPREPELRIDFPGAATARGIPKGSAVVAVLVDADGKPAEFQLIGYTDKAFGAALLEHARSRTYQPAKFKGTAVPGRFDLGYRFESPNAALNPMEASRQRFNQAGGTLEYTAVPESKLDHPLEFANVALPRLPAGYDPHGRPRVAVSVTFYVDESGQVRVPTIQSADSATLFAPAIAAVRQWSFKPPTLGGKPVLVFAGRAVVFLPREAAAESAPAAPHQ
jgi:hypothetical protein